MATAILALAGCATPGLQDLQQLPPEQQFAVTAPLECLYDKGVARAGTYTGFSEAKFIWLLAQDHRSALFRQPTSLIALDYQADGTTQITFRRTSSGRTLGQGDDLVAYLRSNPCSTSVH
jgi:hypothetical protein